MKKEKKQYKATARAEIQQTKVLKAISESIGKGKKPISRRKAMIEAGYSQSYADSGHIKDTRTWPTLLTEELDDPKLMERLNVLLKAKIVQRFIFASRIKDDEIIDMVAEAGFKVITIRPSPLGKMAFYSTDNTQAIDKGLTHAFKLKGKYEPEELNLKFKGYSKEQLIDSIMSKIAKKK